MQEYAKDAGGSLQFATDSEFRMIPNWRTNEAAVRRKGYLPLVGTPEEREGYSATPSRWHVVEQSTIRVEPRQQTVEDYEEDPETHESRKVGEHTEMVDTEITVDTSYIQIDEWEYTELPPPPEPEQPVDVSEQLQQVIQLIMHYCDVYGATEELLGLDEINIESLTALIEKYEVTPEDKSLIMTQVLMIVLDLLGKLDETWYALWNERVQPAINDILQQRRSQSNQ